MRKPITLLVLTAALSACDAMNPNASGGAGGTRPGAHHIIQRGETLYSIAQKAYGDPLKWPRIWEHNAWIDPDRLLVGDKIYIPALDGQAKNLIGVDAAGAGFEGGGAPPSAGSSKPGAASQGKGETGGFGLRKIWGNIPKLGETKVFGQPVHVLSFLVIAGFLAHALLQGFLLWIVATITFAKDVTLKKSLRATFHTELVTLFTVLVLAGVAILMLHIGTASPGAGQSADLLQTTETYLRDPVGMVISGLVVLGLYILLSLRFIPQMLGLQRARSLVLVLFAVLLPNILGAFTLGQRMGLIHL